MFSCFAGNRLGRASVEARQRSAQGAKGDAMTLRAALLLLCCPLVGCATARVIRLDTGEGAPIVYTPARTVPPVGIDQREFEKAMTTLLLEMKFSLSDEPQLRLASAMEEPGGRYHRWCSQQSSPDECLSLLEGDLSLADASVRRQLALSFAWDGVWDGVRDGVASEIRGIVDPVMLKLMINTAFAAYIGLLILPEPVTKAAAVALTIFLIGYVGVHAFFNILNGWRELSARSERARSFGELEDAGHRFGDVMGRDGARVIIMALTAALGGGAANLASKAPKLPGFAQAVLALRTNAGVELSFALEGGARTVTVAEGVMTVGVAPNVVAAVVTGSPGGAVGSALGSGAAKVVRHGPMNPGPLPGAVANTFQGGSYSANTLGEA